ncbi:RES family NAD+ phosphorylase [Paraburkholderia sp. EG285A]|uniref:RES family NAD+ phosphorylase n=1 Tax=Paraburkholderia sp. EG285A TaxID=3237009 RepID=UPI0034D1E91A
MTVHVWRIAADTPDYGADDLTGEGARRTGGRWSRSGRPVLYAAQSRSLAALEASAHQGSGLPLIRYLVQIDIPGAVWKGAQKAGESSAQADWNATPNSHACLDFGDAWLSRSTSAVLLVPSVIVPEEFNVLINPAHRDSSDIRAFKIRKWTHNV